MSKIVVLDNYDSFTYNLVHYIEEISGDIVQVVRNDEFGIDYFDQFDTIFLSPGPGLPPEAGMMQELIGALGHKKNMFGICLGMQGIALNYGAKVKNLLNVYHGVASKMRLTQSKDKIFNNIPDKFYAGRYHSWVVDKKSLTDNLMITCEDEEGNIMALKHTEFNLHGVQFHPESIMTPEGKNIIRNFLLNYT